LVFNLTVKKNPRAVLARCEWGHDDYSLFAEVFEDESIVSTLWKSFIALPKSRHPAKMPIRLPSLKPFKTIYNKLIADFTPNTAKYVFKGIAEFAVHPPTVITGDTYESGIGVRETYRKQVSMFPELDGVHINIFNISKINAEVRGGKSPRIKRLSEYIGALKWLKPAKGQFQIIYRHGADHLEYIPAFTSSIIIWRWTGAL
jgi:hypothetical protein